MFTSRATQQGLSRSTSNCIQPSQLTTFFKTTKPTPFLQHSSTTSSTRQFSSSTMFPQRFTSLHTPQSTFTPFLQRSLLPTTTVLASFNPLIPQLNSASQSEETVLQSIFAENGTQADLQQRAILQQLIEKYGVDSDECKEFVLTTSDLSPNDEIRMLSPCGKDFTQSIYFNILFLRFGRENTDLLARDAAIEYEKCLVTRVDEELNFWQKVHEMSSISAGFVQKIKDEHDRYEREQENKQRQADVIQAQQEAQQYEALAQQNKKDSHGLL